MAAQQSQDTRVTVENVEYSILKKGDQVAVKGQMNGTNYYHHGIFLGHQVGVAHFGHIDQSKAKVRIVDLFHFMGGGNGVRNLFRIVFPKDKARSNEETAKTAEFLADREGGYSFYDLENNNCEHFATKCSTGLALSAEEKAIIDSGIDAAIPLIKEVTLATCPEHRAK